MSKHRVVSWLLLLLVVSQLQITCNHPEDTDELNSDTDADAGDSEIPENPGGETDGDTDGDTDADSDADSDTESDIDSDTDSIADPAIAGPYSYTSTTKNLESPAYGKAKLFYPDDISGVLPALSLTAGWTNVYTQMSFYSQRLASHGFVVLAVTPNNNMGDQEEFAKAHLGAIEKIKQESEREGSPIFGKIDTTRMGSIGYSMGGGAISLLSDDNASGIKAAIGLCPYFGDISTGAGITTPICFLAGSTDTTAPAAEAKIVYDSIPTATPKLFINYDGLGHSTIVNPGSNYGPKLSTHIVSFFKTYLLGQQGYKTYLTGDAFDEQTQAGWFTETDSASL